MPECLEHKPQFTPGEAQQFLREVYGKTGRLEALPSERDQNFHLRESDGCQWVLKIANAQADLSALQLQIAIAAHLNSTLESEQFPSNCSANEGQQVATLSASDGQTYGTRLVSYLEGQVWADYRPKTQPLFAALGTLLGRVTQALTEFDHPGAHRELEWDLNRANDVIREGRPFVRDPEVARFIDDSLDEYDTHTKALHEQARQSIVHGDANDYNLLVCTPEHWTRPTLKLIDFGDVVHTATINELAIALAYALFDCEDPLAAAAAVVSAYHQEFPLQESELELLPTLVRLRLCTSITQAAKAQQHDLNDDYLSISVAPARKLLRYLCELPPRLFFYTLRDAAGFPANPNAKLVADWLSKGESLKPLLGTMPSREQCQILDLSIASPMALRANDDDSLTTASQPIAPSLTSSGTGVGIGIGRYNEPRFCYQDSHYLTAEGNQRSIHLGIDLFVSAGSPIHAPLPGTVHSFADNNGPQDYGPTVILEHPLPDSGGSFFTLYGHLSRADLTAMNEGDEVSAGQIIGHVGHSDENGGWPPHLHFQVILDMMGHRGDFPGVTTPEHRSVWTSLCPNPSNVLGFDIDGTAPAEDLAPSIKERRQAHLSPSLSLSYSDPLHIVRGQQQFLYDHVGRAYLDGVNNVCHVGHCHPRVVQALSQQASVLNTNTRYLHDNIVTYAERLTALFPDPLSVCFLVCSGSEANDLALRLARQFTQSRETIVIDGAYHGNLTSTVEISPYKFGGPGGFTPPPHVHTLPLPDAYRGRYRSPDPELCSKYLADTAATIEQLPAGTRPVFIAESILSCGGQIELPTGYLKKSYDLIRERKGLCIADEVQVGFGRVGSHFWGFETQDVVPDIVTLGKPIGNGHPIGAVITTPEIANAFNNGMEYFNTYGGNPVSCAAGNAVLDVIRDESLQKNALDVGEFFLEQLRALAQEHEVIGDVRGRGLFLGIEFVADNASRLPAPEVAKYVVERLKARRILLSTDGPQYNVIKIKPPLVFNRNDAQRITQELGVILKETPIETLRQRNVTHSTHSHAD